MTEETNNENIQEENIEEKIEENTLDQSSDENIELEDTSKEPEIEIKNPALKYSQQDDDDDDYIEDYSGVTRALEDGFNRIQNKMSTKSTDSNDEEDEEDRFISKKQFEQELKKREEDLILKLQQQQSTRLQQQQRLNEINEMAILTSESYLKDVGSTLRDLGIDLNSPEGELLSDNIESRFAELIAVEQRNKKRTVLTPQEISYLTQRHWSSVEPLVKKFAKPRDKTSESLSPQGKVTNINHTRPSVSDQQVKQYEEMRRTGKLKLSDAIKMLNAK